MILITKEELIRQCRNHTLVNSIKNMRLEMDGLMDMFENINNIQMPFFFTNETENWFSNVEFYFKRWMNQEIVNSEERAKYGVKCDDIYYYQWKFECSCCKKRFPQAHTCQKHIEANHGINTGAKVQKIEKNIAIDYDFDSNGW